GQDRSLAASREHADKPSVIMMVGVNGTGKTTTAGKLARLFVAESKSVVMGAADTFRAAAADQLETWGNKVSVPVVRSDKDGADPASVAFEAAERAVNDDADVLIIDTAGRLQNKANLMDELGKIRRVAEKTVKVDEVLLVLDATTGQNGMAQAKVFAEAIGITGIVLSKMDGSAKGGIVISVQKELGVPVKLVGLGEGPDDLAPFDPDSFVDGILAQN
ncbi:MAG: signal recognition particle-docking protein FtsY, partial [Bifidobacterium crudilactis]|nr:signal recognition particle-docking protein FtsY [Bifidobacterium crudilactis]